jgi:hypothetical protein
VVSVISRMHRVSAPQVVLAVPVAHARRLDGWNVWDQLLARGMKLDHDVVDQRPFWTTDPEGLRDGRLFDWQRRLERSPARIMDASLVLSDNLCGVAEWRSDVVMMGSFLWSDVLGVLELPDTKRFCRLERELLVQLRPPMICVGPIVMPAVRHRTKAIEVGWMCEESDAPRPRRDSGLGTISVLGGATGSSDEALGGAAGALVAEGFDVAVSPGVQRYVRKATRIFEFTAEAYANSRVVVARPGVGTLTQCVSAHVPVVPVVHDENPEMEHNADSCASLGIALRPASSEPADIVVAVRQVIERSDIYEEALRRQPRRGLAEAAEWLDARWEEG